MTADLWGVRPCRLSSCAREMSFADRSALTSAQKLGCAAYMVIGGLTSFYLMVGAALGDCASKADCIDETARAMMFYGTPLITLAGGVLLIRYFMRDRK